MNNTIYNINEHIIIINLFLAKVKEIMNKTMKFLKFRENDSA